MPRTANVLSVLIASPADCQDLREKIHRTILNWNACNSRSAGLVLEPVMWETHSYPDQGGPAQWMLDEQIVKWCDYGIAFFRERLGTPTGPHESGTAAEIASLLDSGRRVSVYFPANLATIEGCEADRLRKYHAECRDRGLIGEYADATDLTAKVSQLITHRAWSLVDRAPAAEPMEPAVREGVRTPLPQVGDPHAELEKLAREFRYRWEQEMGDPMPDIDRARRIAGELVGDIESIVTRYKDVQPIVTPIAQQARVISKFLLFLDGGKSYKRFCEAGDQLIKSLWDSLKLAD